MVKVKRYSKKEMNRIFVKSLGEHVSWNSDISACPLLIDLQPRKLRLRVYLWNCTNPPGGRALDEYKIQILFPGQRRQERGKVDYSDGRFPIIGALVKDGEDIFFAFWDTNKHIDFAYSANLQIKTEIIIKALCTNVSEGVRNNNEKIVCARSQYLYEALIRRMDIMHEESVGG
jgi:hypothetical protein